MMTMEKNSKKELINKYIRQFSPYESNSLGLNVSAVLKLAKEKKCAVKDLSEQDIKCLQVL